ncbi:hypothetical protein Plec18167_001738 [Paecilomyces lecythidis]|uniref:Protein kinase domain-containing protein n=1 Tax=Paecilomyces lecythidis TaxID=3004212 RepID=A0ABR3Y9U4_9EURO
MSSARQDEPSEMSEPTSLWWPEERVKATLTAEYVASSLKPESQDRLFTLPPWGEGLTSETYLDWILTKAGKLFLVLLDIGIPDRIFSLVDQSYDDSDLPIAAHSVDLLKLSPEGESPALDTKFFHAQWRFLVRGIHEGEHVKYTENEGVPVELQRTGLTTTNKDGVEKVVLSGAVCRVFLRTQVKVGEAPHFFDENEVLEEIHSLRRLAHEHVFSVYASYFVDDSIHVLFSGPHERTLGAFLTDVPQSFKRLPKSQRRQILINWPHCLANGLAWLHAQGRSHGAIRPSNVLIDSNHNVFLGHFEALDTLLPPGKVNDVEAYQYAAPERWIRTAAVQETGASRTALPSGGRTARRQSNSNANIVKDSVAKLTQSTRSSFVPDFTRPTSMVSTNSSAASQATVIRVGFPGSPKRMSYALSSSSSGSSNNGYSRKRPISSLKRPIFYAPSIASSNSSDSSGRPVTSAPNPVGLPAANSKVAVVQTWQSHQLDPQRSDIFSLAAVILDIFTHLCKRKISAFVHHRGAKNRTPGRGGGVADASFHLDKNLGQVGSWITLLDHDSKKRRDPIFRALKPMLAVVRDMLAREPERRPTVSQVERRFARAINHLTGIVQLHCVCNEPPPVVEMEARDAEVGEEPASIESPIPEYPESPILSSDKGPVDNVKRMEKPGSGPPSPASMVEFDFGLDESETGYVDTSDTDVDLYDEIDEDIIFSDDEGSNKDLTALPTPALMSPSEESLAQYGRALSGDFSKLMTSPTKLISQIRRKSPLSKEQS